LYLLATGSLLFPTRYPEGFPSPQTNSGAAGGVRVGYRVNAFAGFDAMYEHSSLFTPSEAEKDTGYTLISNRFGLNLRLMSPGKVVRAVGAVGAGLVWDQVEFDNPPSGCGSVCAYASGLDPYGLLEAGVEFELSGVLLDLVAEGSVQPSRGITQGDQQNGGLFANEPLIHLGPGLRVGYAFW
jgi:hypothetical protein